MPRLLGVEIPADKRIEASLTYIYGIGPSTSKRVLEQTNIDPNLRAKDLSPQQINEIIHAITNNKIAIEGDLRREGTETNRAGAKKKDAAPPAVPEPPKENLSLNPDDIEKPKIIKAKGSKNVHTGIAHVLSTFNNTIVTITDLKGNVIGWSSAGKVGFKGSRKSTAYAAQMVAQDASRQAMGHGLKEVEVLVRGPGAGPGAAGRG